MIPQRAAWSRNGFLFTTIRGNYREKRAVRGGGESGSAVRENSFGWDERPIGASASGAVIETGAGIT